MLNSECGHHCIFINPTQVEWLHGLAGAANALFKRLQEISIVDLLYAALWRQISAIRFGGTATTLTVIERDSTREVADSHALMSILRHTFTSPDSGLDSQPLVCVAERIRSSLRERSSDGQYEGWLVDSLESSAMESRFPTNFDGLIGSLLSPPCFVDLVQRRSSIRSTSPGRACGSEGTVQTDALVDVVSAPIFPYDWKLDKLDTASAYLPERIFFINLGDDNSSDGSQGEGRHSSVISIDMWLPLVEIDRFKSLYGTSCFVEDIFFAN